MVDFKPCLIKKIQKKYGILVGSFQAITKDFNAAFVKYFG